MTKQEDYDRRQVERGFKRIKIWVPEDRDEELRAIAAEMRTEHLQKRQSA